MDSPKRDTTNWMQPYENLIKEINNFRGGESYIVDTIDRIATLKKEKEMEVKNLRDVSILLTKITFNIL
jgi:hypothetical protein